MTPEPADSGLQSLVEGWLLDIYHVDDQIYLWLKDRQGFLHLLKDHFYPVIYLQAHPDLLKQTRQRLEQQNALSGPALMEKRRHFYHDREIEVLRLQLRHPSFLKSLQKNLFMGYQRFEIYHSDIDIASHYLMSHNLAPLCFLSVRLNPYNRVAAFEKIQANENDLPRLKTLQLSLAQSPRLPPSANNPLLLRWENREKTLFSSEPAAMLAGLNEILAQNEPDIIISSYGDQVILPWLFALSYRYRVPLLLDRDQPFRRQLHKKGSSYFSYGSIIFRAPFYPLFGRWHIDSENSFLYKHSHLRGVIELAMLSQMPVQKVARTSTGAVMTNMQVKTALAKGYLVPWQKSHPENPRTASQLLRADKGGLVFEPAIQYGNVFENVSQLDFSQMYPSLMVNKNISPETVLCQCCRHDPLAAKVPESDFHICRRRKGVVPLTLAPLLQRRRSLKKEKARLQQLYRSQPDPQARALLQKQITEADERQGSLKWLLVTSFGYLGYRNAKFGRLESHEAVTAFGREILLQAKELAEAAGYRVLQAIVDCIFIQSKNSQPMELPALAGEIGRQTGVEMSIEGTFSWLVFLPSRSDSQLPVANRYFGRYQSGELKVRGLLCRRKDTPGFIRQAQLELLQIMAGARNRAELQKLHPQMEAAWLRLEQKLKNNHLPAEEFFFRKTVTRTAGGYQNRHANALVLGQLAQKGIEIQAGEKIRYLVIARDQSKKYLAEELLGTTNHRPQIDQKLYRKLLREAFREIWEYFAPPGFFQEAEDGQLRLF